MSAENKRHIVWIVIASLMFAAGASLLIFLSWPEYRISQEIQLNKTAPFLEQDSVWADSVLRTMSLEQKVGQLIMIAAGSHEDSLSDRLMEYVQPGGIYLTGGDFERYISWRKKYGGIKGIPLIKAVAAETGMCFLTDPGSGEPYLPGISYISNDSVIVRLVPEHF